MIETATRTGVATATIGTTFDPDWYLRQYADVLALIEQGTYMDPLQHYVMAGCDEGRSPNAEFQEHYYRKIYPDIAEAIARREFSCGFQHYSQHGHVEGRRIRPASRGLLVDLTRYDGTNLLHQRIVRQVSLLMRRMVDWDFWVLSRETQFDALSRIDGVNVARISIDRFNGDVGEHCRRYPITAFLAPLGPSDYYQPSLRTVTIIPSVASANPMGVEGALAIGDTVFCLTPSDRKQVIRSYRVDLDRIGILHLPPSSESVDALAVAEVEPTLAGRPFVLTDLTAGSIDREVALAALAALAEIEHSPCLVAIVGCGEGDGLREAVAARGGLEHLFVVEEPEAGTRAWLLGNCFAVLETGQEMLSPGAIEDVLALEVPLICSRKSRDLPTASDLVCCFDPDVPESIGDACRAVFSDRAGATAAVAEAVGRAFPELSHEQSLDRLSAPFVLPNEVRPPIDPPRELLIGLLDGNLVHSALWFVLPASGASRHLMLDLAVPTDYPERNVMVTAMVPGQPEVPQTIARGRSTRIAISLPAGRVTGHLAVQPVRSDGSTIKAPRDWPCLELRSAAVLAAGLDLLESPLAPAREKAVNAVESDPDEVVAAINAAIDAAAPALNALEAIAVPAMAAKPALRLTVPPMPSILRALAPTALHLTRRQFVDPLLRFHGSNKDQAGRQQYLRDRGFRVLTEPVQDWRYSDLIGELSDDRHLDVQVIIVEAMLHHPLMTFLRERFPTAKLLVRSHNAEVLHRIHTHTATLMMEQGSKWAWLKPGETFSRAKNVYDHWRYDAGAIALADHVLSIAEWETEHYWPYLGPKRKVSTVPYFMPRDLVPGGPVPTERRRQCVCITSASPGPVIYDALRNFVRLVEQLDDPDGWTFPVTGDLDKQYAPQSARCDLVGRVEDPIALMREGVAMALLSSYGYGFKTKILDAVSAGCYTLLPKDLLDRHPAEIRPYCQVVDLSSATSFKEALDRSLEPFPDGDPNEELRLKAYAAMDSILGLN